MNNLSCPQCGLLHIKRTYENDSYNFLHFSHLNISLGSESKINSLCVFQSPRIGNL